jgi:dihydroneopterin aldolase
MIKQLNVNGFKFFLVLGYNQSEKFQKSPIIININLRFSEDVSACKNDKIEHTVCYSSLLNFISRKLENKTFNLVECVAQFVYDEISDYLNNDKILKRVEVIKSSTPIANLESASFICSDW